MKAIQLDQTNPDLETAIESLHVVEKPIPTPKWGQVLIKIESAPCNPSDLLFLQGMYGVKKTFPAVPGWEGSGTVIASGGGLFAWLLKGKRVACGSQTDSDGTWAEYYVTDAKNCIPVSKEIRSDQAATLLINPLTAVGMVEQAIQEGHTALIQTAACSQVGRMVQALARSKKIPLINIVRRADQIEELRSAGEPWILNSEDVDFERQLKALAAKLNATVAFEAISGSLSGKIFNAMPPNSKMIIYGALSGEPSAGFSPLSLIFEQKKLEGFWLATWLKQKGFIKVLQAFKLVQQLMKSGKFQTKIRTHANLDQWKSALLNYHHKMTLGKVILRPNSE